MQKKTGLLLGAGAAALLALGGLAGLAQADMEGEGHGMCAGMGRGHGMMGRGMMGHQMMERYDADKDGKLTQAEIDQNRQQWLTEADADKNGTLSLEEFKVLWLKARNEMMVREFQFFDRDGNGQVTLEEYKGPLSDLVAERDRNNDGSLGVDDRPDGRGEGRGWRHGRGMGHGMMGEGMGHGRGMMGEGMGHGQGMMGQGHGMMGQGMMGEGRGPCMDDDEGDSPAQPDDAPAGTPGDTQTTP